MQSNNLIKATVGVAMGVLLLVILALPLISSATETETTFINEGYFTYDAVTEDTNITLEWVKAAPRVVSIGDDSLTMPDGVGSWTIIGSENFTLRFYDNGLNVGLQCYGTNGYLSVNNNSAVDSATVTITSSSIIFSVGTDNREYTMGTHGFLVNIQGNGNLMLKYPTEKAYILADTEIYLCGTTMVTGSGTDDYVGVFGYGTYDNITLSSFYGNNSPNTVSFGDVTATVEAVNGYIDLYQLEKFNFDITQNSATVTATYSYFVVPSEVTAEKAIHFDSTEITMLELVPLLLAVALVLGIIAYAVRARLS